MDDEFDMLRWRDQMPLNETEDDSFYNRDDYDSDNDSDDGDYDGGEPDDNQENSNNSTSEFAGLCPSQESSKYLSSVNRTRKHSQQSSPCGEHDNDMSSLSTGLSLLCISEMLNEVT